MILYNRVQNFSGLGRESAFLWGPRQTGKSTLLKKLFPKALTFDLLLADQYSRLLRNPSLLREITEAKPPEGPVIIDEVQKIPQLLDEIHWLIVNRNIQFILCGSSPRKILRSGTNLLGGRALRFELFPLIYKEITDFDLLKALNRGLIPRHYMSNNYRKLLQAYTGNYLQDEIMAEARIRNISAFAKFLETAAFSNGEILNYSNIAAECGISSPTVREYFLILENTLTGRFLPSWQKRPKRRVLLSPKFYFFDIGITNHLLKRAEIKPGSESFGKAFEHFIWHEIISHSHYSGLNYPVSYWRTTSGTEVDFILGDNETAVEVKATENANPYHLRGLKSFSEEYRTRKLLLVSNDPEPRKISDILVMPWKIFLEQLWAGEIVKG